MKQPPNKEFAMNGGLIQHLGYCSARLREIGFGKKPCTTLRFMAGTHNKEVNDAEGLITTTICG